MRRAHLLQQRDLVVAPHDGDRPEALLPGQADDQLAELAGAGGQDERLLVLVAHDVEHGERGQRIDDHRRPVLVAHRVDQRDRRGCLGDCVFRPRAPVAQRRSRRRRACRARPARPARSRSRPPSPTPSKPAGWPCLRGWPYWPLMNVTSDGLIAAEPDLDQQLRRTWLRHRDGAQLDIGLHRLQRAAGRLARVAVALDAAGAFISAGIAIGISPSQGLRMSLPAEPRPSTRFSTVGGIGERIAAFDHRLDLAGEMPADQLAHVVR